VTDMSHVAVPIQQRHSTKWEGNVLIKGLTS